jgi:hypothetical protein
VVGVIVGGRGGDVVHGCDGGSEESFLEISLLRPMVRVAHAHCVAHLRRRGMGMGMGWGWGWGEGWERRG